MALTPDELVYLAEMVRESYADTSSAVTAASLNPSQEQLLLADIVLWESIRNSFIKYKGEGVDFDNQRKREAIFYRVRQLLGLPFVIFDLSVELMELVEIEVGQNFA